MHTVCGLLMHASPRGDDGGSAAGPVGREVLVAPAVQGHRRAQAQDQSDAGADRAEGEHPLAGEPAPVHGLARRARSLRPCRRPRERHLRAVLHAPRSSAPTSSSAAASTGWPATAVTRSPTRWTRCRSRACTRSRSATARAASARASVELRYRRVRVLPPIGKQKRYPALALTVIHAKERAAPADRPAIDWKLITDLPVLDPRGGDREAALVRPALEDRGVPQDPEVGLPGGRGAAANRRAPGEADRGLLHPELAGVLDDDDQPLRAARHPWPRPHQGEIALLDRLVPDRRKPGPARGRSPPT